MTTRMTAAAKRAVAEEIVRMADRPESDIAKLAALKSDRLLDEFEDLQAEYVRVPMWEMFGANRPLWKIDPQEAWDGDAADTERVKAFNLLRA